MKKKILITGGAGFIGSHVADLLIARGYDVAILDNLSTGRRENVASRATFYEADITHAKEVSSVFEREKPAIVIHMAAQAMLRKSLQEPIFDAQTNILGTINVLDACRKHGVTRIIYTSTGGARVGEPVYLPVDEKHPLNPISPYGISKHTAEHYVQMYGHLYDLDYLIFCFGNVYGPRDNVASERVTTLFASQMLAGKTPTIIGDGNQTRDFIYITDLAEFIVASLERRPKQKLFHLANGTQISVNEIFAILQRLTGFSEKATYVGAIKGEIRDIALDTRLAEVELGWKPTTDFGTGLEKTVAWLKTQQNIALYGGIQ